MGKGDRRSRRGKLFRGTFGKTRSHKVKTTTAAVSTVVATEAPKKKAPKKKKEE